MFFLLLLPLLSTVVAVTVIAVGLGIAQFFAAPPVALTPTRR